MKTVLALGAEVHLSQYGGWNQLQNQQAYQKIRIAKNKCLFLYIIKMVVLLEMGYFCM